MSLRRQNLSPTAKLLRSSRLFSIPSPLPTPPVSEPFGAGAQKGSATATLPYPTHQAIATTPASLARGDWGLKRPLPSRSHLLQVSNPVLRIKQLDSVEQITDFESAADHVRTREKWAELATPMMMGSNSTDNKDLTVVYPKSAFEPAADVTAYEGEFGLNKAALFLDAIKASGKKPKPIKFQHFSPPAYEPRTGIRRWKHEGPSLPNMSANEFTEYIEKKLHNRREEFHACLLVYVKSEIYATRASASSASDKENVPLDPKEAAIYQAKKERQWARITQEDIDAKIRALRKETAADPLNSKLFQYLITPFLRLPPLKLKATEYSADGKDWKFSDDTMPHSTHPSAGLGYLKTKSYLTTHPILGPQRQPAPTEARVVQPRATGTKKEPTARLGVAGFVADDEHRNSSVNKSPSASAQTSVDYLNVDIEGGLKIWVEPQFGSVTSDGRISLKLARRSGAEIAVKKGALEDRPPVRVASEKVAESGRFSEGLELDANAQGQELLDMLAKSSGQLGVGGEGGGEGK
ncbi:hypothetical protein P154DRAFT_494778 [Amniculicola lignicola CBS 123094]|uniref:Uncharacterized protein n=1 Tax=Amniculicola lignicola CBS 123094 TaxID=1392246 RepID=A0A6A5WAQ3_9PLEO|nr:hypothetical protein P154DRAFT_494778 [Amniculicola lignicola CBS 123094]